MCPLLYSSFEVKGWTCNRKIMGSPQNLITYCVLGNAYSYAHPSVRGDRDRAALMLLTGKERVVVSQQGDAEEERGAAPGSVASGNPLACCLSGCTGSPSTFNPQPFVSAKRPCRPP